MSTVSVIIPAYNAEKYIAETIESVLRQSYQDYEIIVVDDGSTDKTRSILESYTDRVRYFYKENGGPASARNLGIKHARGEYIALLDADDIWLPQKLEKQIEVFEKSPDIGLVHSGSIVFDDKNINPERIRFKDERYCSGDVFPYLFICNFIGNSTVVLRKTCFDAVGLFDESPGFFGTEDYDMWLRISYRYAVEFIPTPLIKYREHANQISRNFEKAYLNEKNVIQKAVRNFPDIQKRVNIPIADRFAELSFEYGYQYLTSGNLIPARRKFKECLGYKLEFKSIIYYLLTFFGASIVTRRLNSVAKDALA